MTRRRAPFLAGLITLIGLIMFAVALTLVLFGWHPVSAGAAVMIIALLAVLDDAR